jgi:hypothetical protein
MVMRTNIEHSNSGSRPDRCRFVLFDCLVLSVRKGYSTVLESRQGVVAADGRTIKFKRFICPNCQALYDVVKVEAGPETIDRQLTCRSCGGPLPSRDGKCIIKLHSHSGGSPMQSPSADAQDSGR